MIKQILVYSIAFALLFCSIHFSQQCVLQKTSANVGFNLYDTNMFFALASFVICVHFLFFSKIKALQPQLGFIYLPTLFIKGALFFLVFKSSVFELEEFRISERLNLLIPSLLFLVLEVFFIAKIIDKKRA